MSFQPCVLFRSQACQLQSQYQSTQNIQYFVTALNCVLTQWALYSVRCTLYLRVGVHYNHITADKQTENTQ